jgi:hypothetical protein
MMRIYRGLFVAVFAFATSFNYASSSNIDTCKVAKADTAAYKFNILKIVAPVGMIGAGVMGLTSDWVEGRNRDVNEEIQENIRRRNRIDNVVQYLPSAALYGLRLCGVKGKHDYKENTLLLGTSCAIMALTVNVLKHTVREQRPDGSSYNSFPSGHTATAFMGAELLWQEYKDVSPWIGVGGYIVATGVGVMRMSNNRHWATDVIAGAGIGILSVKAAYWLYPSLHKLIFGKKRLDNVSVAPFYIKKSIGISAYVAF